MGKNSAPTIGYWYHVAYHHGLTTGPIDAFLEFRGGDKTAWQGELTASGTITVNAPELWGGETDQGGIVGDMDIMFGEPTQAVNPYLVSTFGNQVPAWRGFSTVVFKGGKYGAMNPYPQKASYKIRRILEGWDSGSCWYPEKAEITAIPDYTLPPDATWEYQVIAHHDNPGFEQLDPPASGWASAQAPYAGGSLIGDGNTEWPIKTILWTRTEITVPVGVDTHRLRVIVENGCVVFVNGTLVGAVNRENIQIDANQNNTFIFPLSNGESYSIAVKAFDETAPPGGGTFLTVEVLASGLKAINPAHVLYDSRTCSDMGREPTGNINTASLEAAADTLYAEGFGICPKWDPASESVEEFEQRICKLIGGSFNRSLEDGQWYLDLARGDYVLEDLPILTDDDILDFKEQPSTLDSAINSVSVRYFDPEKKETIVTPPVRALGLVSAFGTIHQTYDCPEIPTAGLATRVAQMKLMATATPTRLYELVTTRRTYAWRPNQYFRLQSIKRGIADMVCIVGDKQSGTLKSGGIRMKATQDIYGLPSTSFVQVEPGVDPRPQQTPAAITLQRCIEAPYIEVVAAMTRANLDALPDDAGFALAVAAAPAAELDFTMMVAPDGGSYANVARGQWAATATVVEAADDRTDADFTLANGKRLDQVTVGMAALWDNEIVRVDAIDAGAGTITLARGCADTVPAPSHAAGSRLWFYEVGAAGDATEYTAAETIDVKLLANTGSQQLPIGSATPMALTFDQRLARPYAPGKVRIDGSAWPATVTGEFAVTWAHRDRILQADQLLDTEAASVGPEETVRYALQLINDATDAVLVEKLDIAGDTATVDLTASGNVRLLLYAISDLGESWQRHEHVFAFTAAGGTNSIDADTYAPTIIFHDGGEVTP